MKKAIVLLSGGIDSSTTLYYAISRGYKCYCLIFDYNQRHRKEILAAKKIAQSVLCPFQVLKFSLPWKGSSLLDSKMKIPYRDIKEIQTQTTIPSTYVPARNTIFLSFALSWAETISIETIFIGANAVDFSGYPDCREEYFNHFEKLIKVAIKPGKRIKILAPLLHKSKAEIILLAKRLKVPLEMTWSCYEGKKRPCGKCDSCLLRAKGFEEAGIKEPLTLHLHG